MENLTEVYKFIIDNSKEENTITFKQTFTNKFDEKTFDFLARLGYLGQGKDADCNERWGITSFGREQAEISLRTRRLNELFDVLLA